jgi:uncharacterized protein DUF6647
MLQPKLFCTGILTFVLAGPVAAQRLELISIPQADQPVSGTVGNPDTALLRSAADWISNVFNLPEMRNLPTTGRFAAGKSAVLPNKGILSDRLPDAAVINYQRTGHEMVAHYDDATNTIYLPDYWNGSTPAEMSALVHVIVLHFQNVGDSKYYRCPEERKSLPYEAQERWLGLYGRSLSDDFKIDPALLMLMTQCIP